MFALLSGPWVRSVFMRFLRSSVCVTREHAQTHEHVCVLSEGTGWDGGRARTAAAPARALLKFIGSPAISPVWENAPAFAITPATTFIAVPEETARRSGRCTPGRPVPEACSHGSDARYSKSEAPAGYHAGLKAEGRWLMTGGGWHRGRLPESEPRLVVRRSAAWAAVPATPGQSS